MVDYGGVSDGQCEFSFFARCRENAVQVVTYGQQDGWTYNYCLEHAAWARAEKRRALAREASRDRSSG